MYRSHKKWRKGSGNASERHSEFFCLCFGLASAPRIFTKLLKIPIKHSSDHIFGRYTTNGENPTEDFDEQGYSDFFITEDGFSTKSKKVGRSATISN